MLGLCQEWVFCFVYGWKTNQRGLSPKEKKPQSCPPKLTNMNHTKTRGVSHCGLAICIKKVPKGKRRIMETQIFHHAKIYSSSKKSSKRNQNPSRYYRLYN